MRSCQGAGKEEMVLCIWWSLCTRLKDLIPKYWTSYLSYTLCLEHLGRPVDRRYRGRTCQCGQLAIGVSYLIGR